MRAERDSAPLRAFLEQADVVSCDLVVTELPRAIRRAGARDPRLTIDVLRGRTQALLEAGALRPLDHALPLAAGRTRRTG